MKPNFLFFICCHSYISVYFWYNGLGQRFSFFTKYFFCSVLKFMILYNVYKRIYYGICTNHVHCETIEFTCKIEEKQLQLSQQGVLATCFSLNFRFTQGGLFVYIVTGPQAYCTTLVCPLFPATMTMLRRKRTSFLCAIGAYGIKLL